MNLFWLENLFQGFAIYSYLASAYCNQCTTFGKGTGQETQLKLEINCSIWIQKWIFETTGITRVLDTSGTTLLHHKQFQVQEFRRGRLQWVWCMWTRVLFQVQLDIFASIRLVRTTSLDWRKDSDVQKWCNHCGLRTCVAVAFFRGCGCCIRFWEEAWATTWMFKWGRLDWKTLGTACLGCVLLSAKDARFCYNLLLSTSG